ncbi:cyclic nucleotide-binding domain-containing protein [Zavarzinella formosa]|uniref:cyclic nucleotide-binding domain-containing protein n=1 Tax=Zavarzinella formosa TaxID=360055 RepID=UPI00031EA09A|nr:cyclic nucleotide-binding domain-containing protein [Zavarzinella formosa]
MPDEIESPFARDDNDELIRREEATRSQFEQRVTVTIDGRVVRVPKAVPLRDALGNFIRDAESNKIPRATTIYDAASQVFTREELRERIPVLCHQEHLHPVAVCRMCSVHLKKKDERRPSSKLFPACQHLVQDGMIVTTRLGPDNPTPDDTKIIDNVKNATKVLAELLAADHLPAEDHRENRYRNELREQVGFTGADRTRFNFRPSEAGPARNENLHPKSRPPFNSLTGRAGLTVLPYDSRSFQVNHDQCILCDRCVRSCSEVKPFKIIGHTGKGYKTRVSFDLDLAMNESGCVQCGECMTACPTGAITLNRRVNPLGSWPDAAELEQQAWKKHPNFRPDADDYRHDHPGLTVYKDPDVKLPAEFPSAAELPDVEFTYKDPQDGASKKIKPFSLIPLTYLRWNEGGVRRREVRAGDVLCRQGEFGATAFLLASGEFDVSVTPPTETKSGGLLSRLFAKRVGAPAERVVASVTPAALILGEMACLTNTARNATIRVTKPGVVYEVRRNVLTMMERTEVGRSALRPIYSQRAIADCLRNGKLFEGLTPDQKVKLQKKLEQTGELLKVEPGQVVLREGDRVGVYGERDYKGDFYFVRYGSIKVSRNPLGQEIVLNRLTANDYFGEIALLYEPLLEGVRKQFISESDPDRQLGLQKLIARLDKTDARVRSATVTGLDTVELVRIRGGGFLDFLGEHPDIKESLVATYIERLLKDNYGNSTRQRAMGEWLGQGFYQARKMLVLDLERCTRCDECTKACADSHPGPKEEKTSRLLREGPRFGKFLVATSCRSCLTPYCMDGCPVDSIHRGAKSLEIRVENHCIGCGLCSKNCPYESIQMLTLPNALAKTTEVSGERRAADVRVAVNCDLCQDTTTPEEEPFCVSACPHEAAFRMDGVTLLNKVAPAEE